MPEYNYYKYPTYIFPLLLIYTSIYFPFYLSSKNVHALSQFLLHIFLLSPVNIVWSQILI
jgi:hypothetical protein